jgi:hypothetical protein
VTANAIGAPNTIRIRPGWARRSVIPMTCGESATSPVHQFVAIRSKPRQERCGSYRVEKRLVHVTPHPVHTPLLVGPGQGMASLAEMLSGVLVL